MLEKKKRTTLPSLPLFNKIYCFAIANWDVLILKIWNVTGKAKNHSP